MTRWTGTDLAPVAESAAATNEVWATCPMADGTFWEALNATMIGHDTARVWAVPIHVYGIHYGDTVGVVASAEGPQVITKVIARGGYTTFRVWLGDECATTWKELAETYAQQGCLVDVWSERLVALACAEERSRDIRNHLERDAGELSFEWELGSLTER